MTTETLRTHSRGASHSEGETNAYDPAAATQIALDDPALYINRELSWLEFNQRVIDEARDKRHPLLERVKFLSIAFANLDEFTMIRVSGLQAQCQSGQSDISPDGLTSEEQLAAVRERCTEMLEEATSLWRDDLEPSLTAAHIHVLDYADLSETQRGAMREYFERQIFPVLTPLAIDPGHPFPHISNLSLNLAVVVSDDEHGERFARMKVPGVLPRLAPVPPDSPKAASPDGVASFVWIEQVIAANLDALFPGLHVLASFPFRVTRNADIEIQEDEASDLLRTIELGLRQRHFGAVARLEINPNLPSHLRDLLISNLLVKPADVYEQAGPLGLSDVMELTKVDKPDIKDAPLVTSVPPELASAMEGRSLDAFLGAIEQRDILLHHPYDSFRPVISFISLAAHSNDVLAIKQTLYRVGSNSPIVKALAEARDEDTQVAVLVELKARFDEENNIEWAKSLEESGVHVVYGLVGLKTHCKVALIVKKERNGIRRYLHLGTGNYNPTTARIYTDFSLFTASEELASDVSDVFNLLTGYSLQHEYRKLLVAPVNMRARLTQMIEREAEHARAGRPARIIFKMNALVDPQMIRSLYAAAQAGVQVDLLVRGICCLRPGVSGVSERIRVISIVGRFLEHSRAYYFHNGGDTPQLYLGSADLMQRNLDRRVEILFPIESPNLLAYVRDDVLEVSLADTAQARRLMPDGVWVRVRPPEGEEPFSAQDWFLSRDYPPLEA
ncbi:MAG: polyphosphate kinase 1 [Capsulimonadaceae bacterium]|nr:polyphosphate kinase 1 [Capsulimonadaceae bacterium]